MKKLAFALAFVVVAIASAVLGVVVSKGPALTHATTLGFPPVVSAADTSAPIPVNNSGQHFTPSSEPSSVDASTVVGSTQAALRPSFFRSATAVVVGKYRYSDDNLAASVLPPDSLVWVVSVNGITMRVPATESSSGIVPFAHQLVIVYDANTGKQLLFYANDITP